MDKFSFDIVGYPNDLN